MGVGPVIIVKRCHKQARPHCTHCCGSVAALYPRGSRDLLLLPPRAPASHSPCFPILVTTLLPPALE